MENLQTEEIGKVSSGLLDSFFILIISSVIGGLAFLFLSEIKNPQAGSFYGYLVISIPSILFLIINTIIYVKNKKERTKKGIMIGYLFVLLTLLLLLEGIG